MLALIRLSVLFTLLYPSVILATDEDDRKLAPIKHIIVFYLENHSFDNLFGTFLNADGITNAGATAIQLDLNDKPYETLPAVMKDRKPDSRFPEKLANKPFLITQYVNSNEATGDLVHRFYQTLQQINHNAMNKFASISDAGGLVMGYYEEKNSPLWNYAKRYTLADHFFTAAFGGSMLNHFWFVCACTPRYKNAPKDLYATLDEQGNLMHDGILTPDGYVVNTIQPQNAPYDKRVTDRAHRLPPLTTPTIGERLDEKNISWAWYGGGWNETSDGKSAPSFIPHHHPFGYFANYAEGTKGRKEHLKDTVDFLTAINDGSLPAIAFYKPGMKVDTHPGYTSLKEGEDYVFSVIAQIEKSPLWKDSLIIVTFDEAGGFWDHVAPPKGDRFGPGLRVPTLIISPFAKREFIDHTTYDTTSILKLIEDKYHLKSLSDRDAKANNLLNALQ